jgi:mannosylglycerate hydrolase
VLPAFLFFNVNDMDKKIETNSGKVSTGHIISHTHWDREWRTPEWNSRWRLKIMMEKLLEKLEANPEFRFLFDGQVVSIHDYLEICPERRPQIEKFIRNNQLQIGPWYNLPDLYPLCGEAIVRNLLTGIREAQKLGSCLKIGYTTFGWGQTAQFPQIYKGFGINQVVCAKNVSKERAPNSEFIWESPDGTQVFTTRLGADKRANFFFAAVMPAIYGYKYNDDNTCVRWGRDGWFFHSADSYVDSEITYIPDNTYHPEVLGEAIEDAWQTTAESLVQDDVFMGNGCDSTAPSDVVDTIVEAANKEFKDKKLIYSDLETYFSRIEKTIKENKIELKTVYGELRDGPVHNLSANALATRMPLKMLNRAAQSSLIRYAESFASLAECFGLEYPTQLIDKAWMFLLLAQSHDAINGVTLDKTAQDTIYKLNQIIEISQVVTDMTARELLRRVDLSSYAGEDILLAVFNPVPRKVEQILEVSIDVAQENRCRRLRAYDSDGSEMTVQAVSHSFHQAPVCVENSRALPFYSDRHKMYIKTGDIPACGFKIIKLVPDESYDPKTKFWNGVYEQPGQTSKPFCMENRYLRVEINPDGTYNIASKVTGQIYNGLGFYEDGGDVGDYWQRAEPAYNKIFYSKTSAASIYLKEDGPLATTYVADIVMRLPARAVKNDKYGQSRSSDMVDIKISTEMTLKADSPYLEVRVIVDNTAMDHRLRVALPTCIDTEKSAAMGHFNVDSRPIVREFGSNGLRDGQMGTLPMQNFVDLSDGKHGLAVLNKDMIEYEVTQDSSRTVYLTLLRCMDVNICTEGRCGTVETGAKGPQCLGEHTFNYAVYPHKGDWLEADAYGRAEKYNYPPRAYQISKHDNSELPESISLFEISEAAIQVSCIKKSQDTGGLTVRLYNPSERLLRSDLTFARKIKGAWLTDLNETRLSVLEANSEDKTISLEFAPAKIVTVQVIFE